MGGLRLAAGVCQFSTVLYITGLLTLSDLGVYSLFVIVLGYASQLAGFSFSTFLIRELGAHPPSMWPVLLAQQLRFLAGSYLLAAAVAAAAIALGVATPGLVAAFGILLLLTLANSAFENYMVGAGHPLPAALNVLLRALWIVPLVALSMSGWLEPSLPAVLLVWMAGELCAVLAIGLQIRRRGLFPELWHPADRAWIRRGLVVGARHTLLALLLLVTISVQRVVLGQFHTSDQVGIFHFFFAISVFIPNLLEASAYALLLPRIIQRHHVAGRGQLFAPDPRVLLSLVGVGGVGIVVVAFLLPHLLPLLGKSELAEYRYLLWFTGPYALMYTSARVFHYQLYAGHRDQTLIKVCGVACAVACVASVGLIPGYGLPGAALALVVAGVAMVSSFAAPFVAVRVAS